MRQTLALLFFGEIASNVMPRMCKRPPEAIDGWIIFLVQFFRRNIIFGIKIPQGSGPVVFFVDDSQGLIFIAAPAVISGAVSVLGSELNVFFQDVAHAVSLPQNGEKHVADSVFNPQAGENIAQVVNVDIIFSRRPLHPMGAG